jgi:filamentous hemagglutinin family protein
MGLNRRDGGWKFGLASILAIGGAIFSADCAVAQITPDGTLGTEGSVVTPNVTIKGIKSDRIDGGARRGTNLFHSFEQFNVAQDRGVYFSNPTAIENILTRVTGNNPSNILGRLGVLGNANLFLLNPNGIIFGRNASLDIRGSFTATTADFIRLGQEGIFSATNPQESNLLSIKPEVFFTNALRHQQATIQNEGNLSVGQDLTFSADNLDLQGQLSAGRDLTLQALDTVQVRDSKDTPFTATAGNQLLVQGNQGIDIFVLNHPVSGLFSGGNIVLRSRNAVVGDAHFWSGGSFRIEQLDGSLGKLFSLHDPIIRSLGDVSLSVYQGASLHILAGGSVNLGTAIVTSPDTTGESINPKATPTLAKVTLSDGTSLVIDGSARPTLDVRAGVNPVAIGNPLGINGNNFTLFFPPPANNPVATSADLTVGDVVINPSNGLVLLTNQYAPNSSLTSGNIKITGDGSFGNGIDARGFQNNGGDVVLDARNNILVNSTINVSADSVFDGNGGDITLLANGNITLNPLASILSNGLLGGNIILKSNADISAQISGNGIQSVSFTTRSDTTGGDIQVIAKSLYLANSGDTVTGVGTLTAGKANAGNVTVRVSDIISILGNGFTTILGSQVLPEGKSNAGKINIDAGRVFLTDGGQISSDTFGDGNGGNLTIDTGRLFLQDRGQVAASTFGKGNAGNLTIKAQSIEAINESSLFVNVGQSATGNGGNLMIDTERLLLTNAGQVGTITFGFGNAGSLIVKARSVEAIGKSADGRSASGLFSSVQEEATGNGGNLTIEAERLTVADAGQISTSTFGTGKAGNLTVKAELVEAIGTDNEAIRNASGLFAQVNREATGNGGNLTIEAKRLRVTDGAQISVGTFGVGKAGNLAIRAQLVEVTGQTFDLLGQVPSGLFADVTLGATGDGGNLMIETERLLIADGAKVFAGTFGDGDAGSITITAKTFEATTGGQISTTTSGKFNAGNITLKVLDSITLAGKDSGLFANTEEGSTGNGGNIFIDPKTMTIRDRAGVAVNSEGTGKGGNIQLQADFLTLDNQAFISAETTSNQGGNIDLSISDLLLMRHNSNISATAGTAKAGGDGGNIDINAKFIVAVPQENSDITANAFEGKGGNINITTQGIFGIEFRQRATALSDLTASSEFGLAGTVAITTPDVDLGKGLVDLPETFQAPLLASGCRTQGTQTASSFVNVGRGGLPPNPNETRSSDAIWHDMRPISVSRGQRAEGSRREAASAGGQKADKEEFPSHPITSHQSPVTNHQSPIIEAQGWIVNPNGQIILTAQASNVTPHSSGTIPVSCQAN